MPQIQELVENWSRRLGLAHTPLLDEGRDPDRMHHALLDGVEGSFALSAGDVNRDEALDWTWSSNMATHVIVDTEAVFARQVAQGKPSLKFDRDQVDRNLEGFLDTLSARHKEPPVTIADHLVGCFRAHRYVAADSKLNADESLRNFLSLIDDKISGEESQLDQRLPPDHRERFYDELKYSRIAGRNADLGVTMRHAAGMVFQETHAELISEPVQPELFGLAPIEARSTRNRLGAYYTPPGLARVLAELAVEDHLRKDSLRILDPACGSGIFLCEVLRALERRNYRGRVDLIGYDLSASAIEMAKFAIRHNDAMSDANITLETRDFLHVEQHLDVDVVLTNPPFLALPDMEPDVKERLESVLGGAFRYRPDLSMAFTSLSLSQLKRGGTLATLLPSGALSQKGGTRWRESVIDTNDIELLAVLGDHGMFRDAMVNVAALVVQKTGEPGENAPTMLWASQKRGASGAALRRLRRWQSGNQNIERTIDWSIYRVSQRSLIGRKDWTPRPFSLGELPQKLAATPNIETVNDLFNVELGVRAGKFKSVLQLAGKDFHSLPARERAMFRPVAETRSIRQGRITTVSWLFYPSTPITVGEIAKRAPRYFERYVEALKLPADDVLDLARARRKTNLSRSPRIVSRAFLGTDSFAVDDKGSYVVVQGYSWLPKYTLGNSSFDIKNILKDYSFILNSRLFFALLRESGRIVGGGQVDGAKNQIQNVPLPDLPALYLETPALEAQARELRELDISEQPPAPALDEFTAAAFRTNLDEWVVSG